MDRRSEMVERGGLECGLYVQNILYEKCKDIEKRRHTVRLIGENWEKVDNNQNTSHKILQKLIENEKKYAFPPPTFLNSTRIFDYK